ncbi:importin-4 [Emys orbicularis]|uniref:importin-4 n=1 Tax=Emys orbicularis TaxID=82168 RepID=UPI0031FD509F
MEPGGLGRVLSDLLQPDNALIQQATAQLREAFRHPEVLPQLCQLLAGAPDPQIRQLAAVLLRRRLTKHWRKLNPEEQDRLKNLVLGALQQEAEHQVSVALAQLAALLLRHQGLERWPQLLQLIQQGVRGPDPHHRQISLLVLSSALESDPEAFTPHYTALLRLFHSALGQRGQPGALYYSLRGLAAMAAGLGSDHLNLMRSLVPKIISAVRQLIPVNEVHASEAMEVFDELMESEVSVIVQHLSDVVGFCLEVASNRALGDALRVKALSTLSFLIKLRGKAVLKQRLLPPVLDALFPILSAEPPPGQLDAEDQEGEDEGDEAQTPKHVAAQVIDMLALHLPPEKLFPQLMPHLEPALRSPQPYQRKAGLMVVAVLAEGCGDHIRTRHLQPLLGVICRSLADESLVVRSAALFALGQFSENLQPDITAYVGEVLPLLLSYLGGVELARGGHLAKAYYALENFVESLGAGIEPFLPVLMEQTLGTLRAPGGPRPKELAISALGAIASAAQRAMGPYLPHVLEQLRRFLPPAAPQEQRPLQCQAVETLGVLVRALGREVVGPLAEESCQLGLGLAEGQDDPDLRRCTYSLFAALSCAMGDDLAPHLPRITTLLLYSLKSTEGLVPPAGDTSSFLLFEDEEEEAEVEGEEDLDGEDDDEEEEELFGLSVESAYVDEKEDACAALGEIAVNASVAFLPYLESCVPEVFQLLEFPHLGVRKAAYEALGQFCIALHRVCERDPSEPHAASLQRLLGLALPAMARGVHRERERLVAMAVLEALGAVLTACRQEALRSPGRLAELCGALRAVLERKTACQDDGLDEEDEEDEEQAEYDAMLLEYAGEGIPALAMAAGGDTFAPYFAGFLPLLLNKMKPSCSVAERSFAVGTLAETLGGLGRATAPFVPRLLPPFLGAARDSDPEVRSNGVFALGVLAEHGGEALLPHYPKILALLAGGSAQEPSARVRDNVCGAVARMVLSQPQALPLSQVFPALLRSLPLTEDFEENKTVFRCISFLYENAPQQVLQQVGEVVRASSTVLGTDHLPADAQVSLLSLLRHLFARCPTEFQAALLALPPDANARISGALGSA